MEIGGPQITDFRAALAISWGASFARHRRSEIWVMTDGRRLKMVASRTRVREGFVVCCFIRRALRAERAQVVKQANANV